MVAGSDPGLSQFLLTTESARCRRRGQRLCGCITTMTPLEADPLSACQKPLKKRNPLGDSSHDPQFHPHCNRPLCFSMVSFSTCRSGFTIGYSYLFAWGSGGTRDTHRSTTIVTPAPAVSPPVFPSFVQSDGGGYNRRRRGRQRWLIQNKT